MQNNRIHTSIAFDDAIIPIIECDDGHQRVPLKPIVEQIGLQWKGQHRKLQKSSYLLSRLGAEITQIHKGSSHYFCIRIDRITTYLNSLNPSMSFAKGNKAAADRMAALHEEMDNALHTYETQSLAAKS